MPYKHINYKIPKELDRRCKLSNDDRETIRSLKDKYSQRQLAKMFDVSRRLIQFILYPDKYKENLERRKERGGSKQYYDKDKWRNTMKEHRSYKQELYLKNQLRKKSYFPDNKVLLSFDKRLSLNQNRDMS